MKTKIIALLAIGLTLTAQVCSADDSSSRSSEGKVAKVAHISGMDKFPQIVNRVAPTYPTDLRERGVQGVVMVEMLIDSMGRVTETKVVRATVPDLVAPALDAARKWQFSPAEAAGKKITSRVQIPFEFTMPQVAAIESR